MSGSLSAPVLPAVWAFSSVTSAASPSDLPAGAGVMNVHTFVASYLDRSLCEISWNSCDVFVTKAFAETVTGADDARVSDFGEFMRPIDAMLVFPGGQ
eukprot:6196226-Pleurochrysis_carterae.AAC.1